MYHTRANLEPPLTFSDRIPPTICIELDQITHFRTNFRTKSVKRSNTKSCRQNFRPIFFTRKIRSKFSQNFRPIFFTRKMRSKFRKSARRNPCAFEFQTENVRGGAWISSPLTQLISSGRTSPRAGRSVDFLRRCRASSSGRTCPPPDDPPASSIFLLLALSSRRLTLCVGLPSRPS